LGSPVVPEVYPVENRSSAGYVFANQQRLIQVTLANETVDTVRVSGNQSWTDLLTIRIDTVDGGAVETAVPFVLSQITQRSTGLLSDSTFVAVGEAQEARLQVAPARMPGWLRHGDRRADLVDSLARSYIGLGRESDAARVSRFTGLSEREAAARLERLRRSQRSR
jgi:hypothetical protein